MPILKNKIFIYITTRYITYALQFLLSLAIAVRLGPFYLGVYGMVNLVISYFGQINFGVSHALNVFLIHNKENRQVGDVYSYNALALYTYLNMVIVIGSAIISMAGWTKWGEYDLGLYFPLIIAISILTYYNSILTAIIRVRNEVNALSAIGSIGVFLNLCIVWFFKENSLVLALTLANLLACILTAVICIRKGVFPQRQSRTLQLQKQKSILQKGLYLFLYNSCFYFILISIRTIISANYTVEEFGYFTFSFTIANAVMLLLDSFNTILFPKTIDLMSSDDNKKKADALEKMRVGYISTSHMLVYLAMICFPVLVWLIPKYMPALSSMNMIALAVLMNTNSYGYSNMLIAQNKECKAGFISAVSLIVNIILGLGLAKILNVEYSYIIIATLVAYMISSFLMAYEGDTILREKKSVSYTLKHFFPIRMFIPYMTALVISCTQIECLIFIPLLVFIILNYKDLQILKNIASKLIREPEVIDV